MKLFFAVRGPLCPVVTLLLLCACGSGGIPENHTARLDAELRNVLGVEERLPTVGQLKLRWILPAEEPPQPGCPELYDDEVLQDFYVELAPEHWEQMLQERDREAPLPDGGPEFPAYRPLTKFEHNGRVATDAMIRLRGNPFSWSDQEKMQFQISFKERNPKGRFRGARKIVLDAAANNYTWLRDRLAVSVLRDLGVAAPCVNHARLFVNGQYYGLYANIEKIDREFLERNFPDPDGNLWKMTREGSTLKTNEDERPDTSRHERFWKLADVPSLEELVDVKQAVRAWAAEAAFPDEDGYWAGGLNFYWYEAPDGRFTYLPWDLDLGFDRLSVSIDPLTWDKSQREVNPHKFHGHPHVDLALDDPRWRAQFVEDVALLLRRSPATTQLARLDKWAAQIREAAREDPHAPWSFEKHERKVREFKEYVREREQFLHQWVSCVRANGLDSSGCR